MSSNAYHLESLSCLAGYDLNGVLDDLVRYNFVSNQWEEVTPSAGARPVSFGGDNPGLPFGNQPVSRP